MVDVLIAAAHPSELFGLKKALGPSLEGQLGGLRIQASAVGVGMLAAAIGTMQLLRATKPRALILLGSCGAYQNTSLLTAAVPESMLHVDAAVSAGEAAFPAPMPTRVEVHRALGDAIAKHAGSPVRGSLATTAGITTSDELARKLARSKCATENLEGLAVGLACEKERVAFAALLLVTNQVGEQGREQWLQNHQAAAERGAAILLEWIDAGAAGLPAS